MDRKSKILLGTTFLLFAGLFVINKLRKSELKRSGITLNGIITSYDYPAKSSIADFKYRFNYKGKEYSNNDFVNVKNPSSFIGKSFPVKFSPKNGESQILIIPQHFEKYGLKYPDSLAWVKVYIIKGI